MCASLQACALEPLRIANLVSGQVLYRWSLHSENGKTATSSNGCVTLVEGGMEGQRHLDRLFLISGIHVQDHCSAPVLGWLRREDCAPEFARELFAAAEIGVLPRLVHSRFGLHVVEVIAREAGHTPGFETVRSAVALALRQQTFVSALRQYLQLLAGAARVEGVVLDSADTPLVQ